MLIVVPWDSANGGVTSVVKHLSEYLELRGHRVLFLHPDRNMIAAPATTKLGFPGFRIRLPGRPPHGWTWRALLSLIATLPVTTFQLVRLLRSQRIDVVNVHFAVGAFAYFALCRQLLRIRLVTSIHGADFLPHGKPRASIGASVRYLLRRSDVIVAPSEAFLAQFRALAPRAGTRARTIHNGIDVDRFLPAAPAAARSAQEPVAAQSANGALAAATSPRIVLSIAQHEAKKGLDVLLDAFARLYSTHPDLELLLVGDGTLRYELEAQARTLGVDRRTHFLGSRTTHEVADLLQRCEVFVLPSRAESFGIAVVEAMASGRPVVASRVDGLQEVIEDGTSGILVPPDAPEALADALRRVLSDASLRASLSANALLRARSFSSARMGASYEDAYRQAIARGE